MNLLLENFIKNLHSLMLPSSLWGIHVDPKFQFIAVLNISIPTMERLYIEKGVLLTINNDSINVLLYLRNELIYLPWLESHVKTIPELTKLLHILHNEVNICSNYRQGTTNSECMKYVLRSQNTLYCQACSRHLFSENDGNINDGGSGHILPSDSSNMHLATREAVPETINDACYEVDNDLNTISCTECNIQFHSESNLVNHRKVHLKTQNYVCKICNQHNLDLELHKKHVLSHDNPKANLCNICGKFFFKKYRLKDHMITHMEDKPFKCSLCGKTFAKDYNLKTHERVHSGERPFICSKCGKTFVTASNLSTHSMNAHQEEKRHRCDICDMSFVHPRFLRIHKRKHSGEKPFQCSTCGRTFAQQTHLMVHIRIHTGEKPYVCDICQKSFTTTGNLNAHKKTHQKDPV